MNNNHESYTSPNLDIVNATGYSGKRTISCTTSKYYKYLICLTTAGGTYNENVSNKVTVSDKTTTNIYNETLRDANSRRNLYNLSYATDVPSGSVVTIYHDYEGVEIVIGIY